MKGLLVLALFVMITNTTDVRMTIPLLCIFPLHLNSKINGLSGTRSNYDPQLPALVTTLTEAVCCCVAAAANLATWLMIGEKFVGP